MKWKDISVFISSTFNDMHAERDYVLKNVFPQLGEWCEQKHIFLRDIDLRWGVTPQDSQTRNTIYKCLTAAARSSCVSWGSAGAGCRRVDRLETERILVRALNRKHAFDGSSLRATNSKWIKVMLRYSSEGTLRSEFGEFRCELRKR